MILRDLLQVVEAHQPVSLPELSTHFNIPVEVIEPMLMLLVRKGRIEVKINQSACGQCQQCPQAQQSGQVSFSISCVPVTV